MTPDLIAGAWYGDYLPTGEFVATVTNSHMQTHLGRIDFPPGETFGLVTPRCTNVGGFRFAGQAHDLVGVTWEWDGAWHQRGPTNGVNGCIYDLTGTLRRAGSDTSQGYRYVTPDGTPAGRLVTGDATYGPAHGLNEYTDLSAAQDGSLLIGQGNPDAGVPEGAMVWDGARVRVLEFGSRRFINAHPQGEAVSMAIARPEGVALISTTMADLRALPPVVSLPPVEPIPLPPAPPETPMRLPDGVQAIVEALYLRHVDLARGTDDQRRTLTRTIVEQTVFSHPGQGYGWKSSSPTNPPSKDSLARQVSGRLVSWDLFNGTTRAPNDHPEAEDITGQHFIPVLGADHLGAGPVPVPVPVPVPSPQPVPADLSALVARIAAAEAAQKRDHALLVQAIEWLDALKAAPPPLYRVVGRTSRAGWHDHGLDVRLEPIL